MRKLFAIITLLVSSFFFISTSKVYAQTYQYEINSDIMSSIINEDFYTFRNKVIEYCNNNHVFYVITYSDKYTAYIIKSIDNFSFTSTYPTINLQIKFTDYDSYVFENNEMVYVSSASSTSFRYFSGSSSSMDMFILDSNFDLNYNKSHILNITYKDFYYSVSSGTIFPTLYKIYLDENPLPMDPFEEDKVILDNFYSTILIKVSDLASNLASNYTFLIILGIFLLIFVFELIWRRFI